MVYWMVVVVKSLQNDIRIKQFSLHESRACVLVSQHKANHTSQIACARGDGVDYSAE